jgi:hypothetical protein
MMTIKNLLQNPVSLLLLLATAAACQAKPDDTPDPRQTQPDANLAELVDAMPGSPKMQDAVDGIVRRTTSIDLSHYPNFDGITPLFVPHNGMLILPVDGKSKSVAELQPGSVVYLATKASCSKNPESWLLEFLDREADRAAIPKTSTGLQLADISLEMPLQGTPPGPYATGSGGMCFGWRDSNGWHWSLEVHFPISGKSDAFKAVQIETNLPDVDALALIFADGTFVDSIKYQTQP